MERSLRGVDIESLERVVRKVRPNAKRANTEKVVDLFLGKSKRKRYQLGQAEREQLVLDFRVKARKLARSILRKWHARLDLLEVDSVVDLSLCEAVKRYDPNRGASFMTFLFYHLRGNLIRAVSTAASQNVVPLTECEEVGAGGEAGVRLTHNVSALEVAEALCNHECVLPDEALFRKELMNISSEACAKLDVLEREVIYRIYVKEQQLIDVAHSLGYSRCHISRVKKKALDTLCASMAAVQDEVGYEINELRKELAEEGSSRALERRRIHRRRPRSRKALAERERVAAKLAVAA